MSSAAPVATSTGFTSTVGNCSFSVAMSLSSWSANGAPPSVVFFSNSRYSRRCQPVNFGSSTSGEVVDAGVDLAVDLLDQAGQRLDALPRHARRRVRVLRGLQIVCAHRVGEHLDDADEFVDLTDRVSLVVRRRLLGQRIGSRSGSTRRGGRRTGGGRLFGTADLSLEQPASDEAHGYDRH